MQPTKEAAIETQPSIVVPVNTVTEVSVPTNVKLIEPTIEISEQEAEQLEEEFLLREERNQYHHLAYSQY